MRESALVRNHWSEVVVGGCDALLIAVVADFVIGRGGREVELKADELNKAHA